MSLVEITPRTKSRATCQGERMAFELFVKLDQFATGDRDDVSFWFAAGQTADDQTRVVHDQAHHSLLELVGAHSTLDPEKRGIIFTNIAGVALRTELYNSLNDQEQISYKAIRV